MAAEKRRSERVMLTIPLRVHGTDPNGASFKESARTIVLNRHGAAIHSSRPLRPGEIIRIVNELSQREAEFRVVGPVAPLTEAGGQWGVECLDPKKNIWGIQFPPPAEGQDAEAKALLECRKCHTLTLQPVSLVEVEVLETSGLLSRRCRSCDSMTPWGYADKQVAMTAPEEPAMLAQTEGRVQSTTARGADKRRHRRFSLQLPALIRDYYGGVEITKSENVSKGGFCFVSEKNYHVGQGIMAVCPYSTASHEIEVRARIVRRRAIEGTNRKIYGVRYEPQIP